LSQREIAMRSLCVMLLLVAVSGSGVRQASRVTPIQKVLQMMDELKAKAVEEKKAEISTFNEFTKFCKETLRAKGYAIKDSAAAIEQLEADIQKYDADVMVLGEEIKTLSKTTDDASYEKRRATEVNDKRNADYQKVHSDYVASIDDLAVGIVKLKKMMSASGAASAAASSLIQELAVVHFSARKVLTSFLAVASRTQVLEKSLQPEPAAFESQSDGIVDMMKELEDKLVEEKAECEKTEMQEQHGYDMLAQGLDQQIKKATEERSDKSSLMKKKEGASASAKGDLAETTNAKKEDEKYSVDLTAICEQKSADFEARQKLRAEELVAIDKAKSIISDQAVAGSGDKHLPSLVQRAASLVQLRSGNQEKQTQAVAASFLKLQARKLGSRILSMLSTRVSADPFVKVRKMIEDMITKLTEEAADEAEHKAFCDEELSSNLATRDEKTSEVEELSANIEEMTATSEKLSSHIATLRQEIIEIDSAVAKATNIRNAEKAKNTETVANAKQAIEAVSQATKVLKEFYEKAATATALVQRGPADDVPETFDKPFIGTGGEGGILGMLEVILSDFQRLEAETTEMEAANAKEYESFMADSSEDKESKHQSDLSKDSKRTKINHDIKLAKKAQKQTQAGLDAALEYYEKLKPSCVDAGVSYEDRVAQRENEIASLKEALKILEGEE